MKLVYLGTNSYPKGQEVQLGDKHTINGFKVRVIQITEPFTPDEEDMTIQVERGVRLNNVKRWLRPSTLGAAWI
jgi:hypothetical protein